MIKIRPKKGYYDENWELIEESENYYICKYPGLITIDALPKDEYEVIEDDKT